MRRLNLTRDLKKMKSPFVQSYLFFGGRCQEALDFYRDTLGAKISFVMPYKESPEAMPPGMVPPGFEDKIMHATFQIGETTLMASDGNELGTKFEGFSLLLSVVTEAEAQKFFAALAEGGQVSMPLGKTFWSPCFGVLTDRFGIGWKVTVAA